MCCIIIYTDVAIHYCIYRDERFSPTHLMPFLCCVPFYPPSVLYHLFLHRLNRERLLTAATYKKERRPRRGSDQLLTSTKPFCYVAVISLLLWVASSPVFSWFSLIQFSGKICVQLPNDFTL